MPENTPAPDQSSDDTEKNWKAMREQQAQLKAQADALKSAAVANAVAAAGFDPADPLVGLIKERWEKDLSPESISRDAFSEYAKQFNLTPISQPQATDAQAQPQAGPTAGQQQMDAMQARPQQVAAGAGTPTPTPSLQGQREALYEQMMRWDISPREKQNLARQSFNLGMQQVFDIASRRQPSS